MRDGEEKQGLTLPTTLAALRVWLRDTEDGRILIREAARRFLEKGSLSEILDSSPPQDLDIERRLIGMLIVHPETIVSTTLLSAHFHGYRNRRLYKHLVAMGGATDLALLVARLKEHGDYEDLGGAAYLAEATYDCGMPGLATHYCKVLRNHAIRRAIINTADRMLVHAYAARMPVGELVEKARLALDAAAEGK